VPDAATVAPDLGQELHFAAPMAIPVFVKASVLKVCRAAREMDLSLRYIALASGKVDLIAEFPPKEGSRPSSLFQLEDDRQYFPPMKLLHGAPGLTRPRPL